MPFSQGFKKRLAQQSSFTSCEFCGASSRRLANNGLHACHIVSDSSGGPEHSDNCLVLCGRCSEVFDRFLKPAIAKAFDYANKTMGTKLSVPADWITAEGRAAKGDMVTTDRE